MGTYYAGAKVRISNNPGFQDANGNLVDPTAVVLKYQATGAAAVTKNYPADITRDSLGLYHYDVDTTGMATTSNVQLEYEWIATGTGQAAQAGVAIIQPLPV